MSNLIFKPVSFIIFFSLSIFFTAFSQEKKDSRKLDCFKDTLIIISHKTICEPIFYLYREDLLNADTLYTNQAGLSVYSYKVSSFTLGNKLNLTISSELISNNIKKAVAPNQIQYKFLNFSDIILMDEKNNIVKPTLYKFKLIFLN